MSYIYNYKTTSFLSSSRAYTYQSDTSKNDRLHRFLTYYNNKPSYSLPCPYISNNNPYTNYNNDDDEEEEEDEEEDEEEEEETDYDNGDEDDEEEDAESESNSEERGSVAFFSTYRTPVPMDIYSSPINPGSCDDEYSMTDGKSYNYNGRDIPPNALKTLLTYTRMRLSAHPREVDLGTVTGLVFVSERTNNLETLHFALLKDGRKTEVFNFAQLYTNVFKGVRMEDSGCFAGDRYFVYVSTKERNVKRRQPWTAVYRTDLTDGHTVRLTPRGVADFSPSVSPSGKQVAVASLGTSGEWEGEIERLKTDIYVMDVNNPKCRRMVIKNGGWPSWGSDDVIFFHRATPRSGPTENEYFKWGVFRQQLPGHTCRRMTPPGVDAMTPAAINENKVAVAIIRKRLDLALPRTCPENYRHIEVFNYLAPRKTSVPVTQNVNAMGDHYNPFVISNDDDVLIGYNCCISQQLQKGEVASDNFDMIQSEFEENLEVFRVPGVFPTFTQDGRKLAFVDNDFQHVYLADIKDATLRVIFSVDSLELSDDEKNVFSPVWSQNPDDDLLLICVGPPFSAAKEAHIYAIKNASSNKYRKLIQLTRWSGSNNAFPSTNPDGTRFVFRSTRDWVGRNHTCPIRPKNLYIMEMRSKRVTRISNGDWSDTHCQWSPNGQWIVFSSTRGKPSNAPRLDHGLDPGYYSIYLLKANEPDVVVRVLSSGGLGAGHVNHPMFSPDGESIVFAADLAGVSVEPISLPLFLHSVRPYGDIFSVDIDDNDIGANKDIKSFHRLTHSRFENSTPSWSLFSTRVVIPPALIKLLLEATWHALFSDDGDQSWQCTGHLGLDKRCC